MSKTSLTPEELSALVAKLGGDAVAKSILDGSRVATIRTKQDEEFERQQAGPRLAAAIQSRFR